MSDKKHIEYCIRLGNTFMQSKLEEIQNNSNYIEHEVDFVKIPDETSKKYKNKFTNWNSY